MGILDAALQAPDALTPQAQGILKAAFALMSASAPTRVPTGFGPVLGQAGAAGIEGYESAKKSQLGEALQALQAKKLASDLALQDAVTQGGDGILSANSDPDKLEALGTRLSAAGHPGGASLITAAERLRAKKQAQARLGALQSTPEGEGGLFAPYFSSPFVGEDAHRLQRQLDKEGAGANPDDYLKRLDALASAHRAAQAKEDDRLAREANLPKSEHVVQDKASPTGWSYEDTRSGKRTLGAPPPTTGAATGDVIPPQHKDLHGDDYLATLPTGMGNLVKKIADGDMNLATAASLRYGNREAIAQRVAQYDPSYSDQRFKVKTAFKDPNSKTGGNIIAINQSLAHAGTLLDLSEAMKNGNIQQVNKIINLVRDQTGDSRINNADLAAQALSNELMRVFRQVNASESETKQFEEKLAAAKRSPQQMAGALQTGAKLLYGRINALQDQYHRGTGLKEDFPILGKESQAVLARLGVVGKDIPLSDKAPQQKAPRRWNPATGKLEDAR